MEAKSKSASPQVFKEKCGFEPQAQGERLQAVSTARQGAEMCSSQEQGGESSPQHPQVRKLPYLKLTGYGVLILRCFVCVSKESDHVIRVFNIPELALCNLFC